MIYLGYYLLILFGAFLIALNGFIQLHDKLNAYTIGGIIGFMIVPLISYPFFLSIVSSLGSYVAKRNLSLFLPVFSWLFFISGFFDVTVGTYTKLWLEPKIKTEVFESAQQGKLSHALGNSIPNNKSQKFTPKKWQDAPIIQEQSIREAAQAYKIQLLLGKWQDRNATVEISELGNDIYKVSGDTIEENDDYAPATAGFSFRVTKEDLLQPEIILSDGGCKVTLSLEKETLKIMDNQGCGGMNVVFNHELKKSESEAQNTDAYKCDDKAKLCSCDSLRLCAFDVYPKFDDRISSPYIVADAILNACNTYTNMCIDEMLMKSDVGMEWMFNQETREEIKEKIKKDWVVSMILSARAAQSAAP